MSRDEPLGGKECGLIINKTQFVPPATGRACLSLASRNLEAPIEKLFFSPNLLRALCKAYANI